MFGCLVNAFHLPPLYCTSGGLGEGLTDIGLRALAHAGYGQELTSLTLEGQ